MPETKAAKDRKEKYSDYEVFEEDFEQNQLWTIDVADDAEAKQVTSDAKINVGSDIFILCARSANSLLPGRKPAL